MLKYSMRGRQKMIRNLERAPRNLRKEIEAGAYQEANTEMTESKRLCPVDITENAPHPGQLRASGRVLDPRWEGNTVVVDMAYGGGPVDYALYVHEDLEAHHPVGQAKYLEQPLMESSPHMAARIARRVDMNRVVED